MYIYWLLSDILAYTVQRNILKSLDNTFINNSILTVFRDLNCSLSCLQHCGLNSCSLATWSWRWFILGGDLLNLFGETVKYLLLSSCWSLKLHVFLCVPCSSFPLRNSSYILDPWENSYIIYNIVSTVGQISYANCPNVAVWLLNA